jgi:hypothetical protein
LSGLPQEGVRAADALEVSFLIVKNMNILLTINTNRENLVNAIRKIADDVEQDLKLGYSSFNADGTCPEIGSFDYLVNNEQEPIDLENLLFPM